MSSTSEEGLRDLIEARDLALTALQEITPAATIGDPAGYRVEEGGVVSLLFENRMLGYPGWYWTVSLGQAEGEAPTVLEAELLPGEAALLAPDWVPWAVRLAEYQAAQAAAAAAGEATEALEAADSEEESDDDEADDDGVDFDDEDAYDLDGVDIDALDDSETADEDEDEDEDEESEDEDEDEDEESEDEDEDEDEESEDEDEDEDEDSDEPDDAHR